MIGPRTRIVLLTSFFTFAFSMLFLALFENYVKADIPAPIPVASSIAVDVVDIKPLVEYEIIPRFGMVREAGPEFDFDSDDSFQKFLHDDHPFYDKNYMPTDLLPIDSNFTANNSKSFKLREDASIQFADMARHFWYAFSGDKLYIASAWRSRGFQDFLIRQ